MRADTPRLGDDQLALLSAIDEGLIYRDPTPTGPIWAYWFDGEPISYLEVQWLAKRYLIDVSLAYPPAINAYGARVLREYIDEGGYGSS